MKTIYIKWSTDDVLYTAENMGINLNEKQADEILEQIEKYHDAEIGINWVVIETSIDTFIDMKENKKLN
tara:strand:+ start:50 stop:256 length:207 start_codon:yes stop_codon:yes gene_type:complete